MGFKIKNSVVMELAPNQQTGYRGSSIWQERSLPPKVRYWLSRILDRLQTITQAIEKERIAICEQYCTRDADGKPVLSGNSYSFPKEAMEPMKKELEELSAIENEIEFEKPRVDIDTLPPSFSLSATEMVAVGAVVEFFDAPTAEVAKMPTKPKRVK